MKISGIILVFRELFCRTPNLTPFAPHVSSQPRWFDRVKFYICFHIDQISFLSLLFIQMTSKWCHSETLRCWSGLRSKGLRNWIWVWLHVGMKRWDKFGPSGTQAFLTNRSLTPSKRGHFFLIRSEGVRRSWRPQSPEKIQNGLNRFCRV